MLAYLMKCAWRPCDHPAAFGVSLRGDHYQPACWAHAIENLPRGQYVTIEYAPLEFAFPNQPDDET